MIVPQYSVRDDRIVGVKFQSTPNRGGRFKINPSILLLHYTAGPSLESAVSTFVNPARKVSAHVIIDRDGKIVQCVPFSVVAWHAGTSEWDGKLGINNYAIGIEMVNAGILLPKDGKDDLQAWWGRSYPRAEALWAEDRRYGRFSWWHKYTDVQLAANESLCQALTTYYPIKAILGHEEVALPRGRKSDPGPAFPLEDLRERLGLG